MEINLELLQQLPAEEVSAHMRQKCQGTINCFKSQSTKR